MSNGRGLHFLYGNNFHQTFIAHVLMSLGLFRGLSVCLSTCWPAANSYIDWIISRTLTVKWYTEDGAGKESYFYFSFTYKSSGTYESQKEVVIVASAILLPIDSEPYYWTIEWLFTFFSCFERMYNLPIFSSSSWNDMSVHVMFSFIVLQIHASIVT